MRRTG